MLKPKGLSVLLHVMLCLTSSCTLCRTAKHYCVNGRTMRIQMDDVYHMDETIIPEIPDEPIDKHDSYRQCQWEINVRAEPGANHLQLVLGAVPAESSSNQPTSESIEVPLSLDLKDARNVSTGMFRVGPLSQSNHFNVAINWNPKLEKRSPVNLRILIPSVEFCSRDMLSFRGNCHAFNPTLMTAEQAVCRCQGDAQLASFNSMADIKSFIDANNDRLSDFPFMRPLNLSEAVRIGLFYNKTSGAVLFLVRDESGCRLRPVEKPDEMLTTEPTGACGSLQVTESGQAVIEFVNCSKSMVTLMMFSETVTGAAKADCRTTLTPLLIGLEKVFLTVLDRLGYSARQATVTANSPNEGPGATIAIALVSAVISVLVISVVAFLIYRRLSQAPQSYFENGVLKMDNLKMDNHLKMDNLKASSDSLHVAVFASSQLMKNQMAKPMVGYSKWPNEPVAKTEHLSDRPLLPNHEAPCCRM